MHEKNIHRDKTTWGDSDGKRSEQIGCDAETLRQVALFSMRTESEIEAIVEHATTQSYPRGSSILRKGDPASAMLIILQGRVRVGMSAVDGREIKLRVMGPGDNIGEVLLLLMVRSGVRTFTR